MQDRESTVAEIKRQIHQRVVDLHGEARAEKNSGEIETVAGMVKRVRRLEIPAFQPLDQGADR